MADVTRHRLTAIVVLLVGVAALAIVWRVAPSMSPPLYDGLCTPDAYRVLGGSPAPATATQQYQAAAAGAFATSEVVTTEQPPQAQALMTDGTFVSAQPFSLSLTPIPTPAGATPAGQRLDGNVYRIVATTASGGDVEPVDAQHPVTILLRGTSSNPPRTLARLDGSAWVPLKTFLVGCGDTFEATSPKLGDFALLAPGSNPAPQSGGLPVAVIAAGGTALVLVILLGAIRIIRSRAR